MRRTSALFLGLLVVIASCGSSPDVPQDTDDVATEPRTTEPRASAPAETEPSSDTVTPSAPLPRGPVPAGPAAPPGAKVGFVGGTRFIVFAQEGERSFSVFDRDRGETFHVLGEPIGEPVGNGNRFMEMGLADGAPQWNLRSDREGRILTRSIGGVQLVDLADHGRMIAAWRGEPLATSLAQDGATFSVATTDALHIVRASDGAFATFKTGGDASAPTWGDTTVHWVASGALTRVNRETLVASVVRAPTATAQFATASEAAVVAFASEGAITVHVAGAQRRSSGSSRPTRRRSSWSTARERTSSGSNGSSTRPHSPTRATSMSSMSPRARTCAFPW